MNLRWRDRELLDDGYVVGHLAFDRLAADRFDDPWRWVMRASSRFAVVAASDGLAATAAEAKAALERAYAAYCDDEGAREDYFAASAAADAADRSS